MKISVIGTGYVGLVTGTYLAEVGNDVLCLRLHFAVKEPLSLILLDQKIAGQIQRH
jgi:UDPglucose 6-dehydrogenase